MNTIQTKTAIIVGATGLIGNHLLNLLLNSPNYAKVIIFTKRPSQIQHSKLEEHQIDFENIQDYKHHIYGDDFFCTLGTTIKKAGSQEAFRKVDLEYPCLFADIAFKNNVKHFLIISSIGADEHSNNFYLKTKGELESKLRTIPFDSLSIFRPSLLLGNRKEFRLGEKIATLITPLFSFFLLGGLKKYRPIKAETVAKAMLNSANQNNVGFKIYESDGIEKLTN
jgi:uncharacterized protein YbjT (DUF2867 family)